MPYIDPNLRPGLEPRLQRRADTPGDLNFQITCLLQNYLLGRRPGYGLFNDIVGALESAKAEFQRRVVAPYEDRKIEENGDVYYDDAF